MIILKQVALFERLDFAFDISRKVDRVEYILPDKSMQVGYAFKKAKGRVKYDEYGYCHFKNEEPYCDMVRFTASIPGVYVWRAMSGDNCSVSGEFEVVDKGALSGYVMVSDDRHYFMLNNSQSYVPIGIKIQSDNLNELKYYSDDQIGFGLRTYIRRIKHFIENGGNLICISLTDPLFNCRTEFNSVIRHEAFFNLDYVIEFCRDRNVKVKLTLDSFKSLEQTSKFAKRDCCVIKDNVTCKQIRDIIGYLNDDDYFEHWFERISPYLYRYWNETVVMAFELWDENDLIDAPIEDVLRFSKKAVERIRKISPNNLITTSLSPLNTFESINTHKEFFDGADFSFSQVRRFLNCKAALSECRNHPGIMAGDAIERTISKDKPIMLSETGAVDGYTGKPYSHYNVDYDGLLINDCTFTPFFKGAAGTGIISHLQEYVEPHKLYACFEPFSQMLHNVKIHKQRFKTLEIKRKKAYVYVLKGRTTTLIYVRSKVDTCENVLMHECKPFLIKGISLPSFSGKKAKLYPLYNDDAQKTEIVLNSKNFQLPAFRYGYFIKIR